MVLNSSAELGRIMGSLSKEQELIKQNISPDQSESQDQYVISSFFSLQGTATLTKLMYPTDSFILDHPVYGELDSSVLKLDGGYDTGNPDHNTQLDSQSF